MVEPWNDSTLQKFLRLRQELFLDPLGSNRKRFEDAAVLLQRALFSWYFSRPGEFKGLFSLVQQHAEETRLLRKEEGATISDRRFALNYPAPEIPAIESGVSENQWQQIYGLLGTGHGTGQLFERFLIDLDVETNPSLRINHRYLGELLPHDNMVSYFSSMAATFLNENAIIGKVSPCVTHMEQAAMAMLAQLVGWDGKIEIEAKAKYLPLQRLPTPYPPALHHERWAREQPTGTIVGDGTIANISALLIARNATFNYLLGWGEAVQQLGPQVAWEIIKKVYGYKRMMVVTSKGAHYSVLKAAHLAGVGPIDVIEVAGSSNPWILDGVALQHTLTRIPIVEHGETLLLALVLIAGKTETGYIDRIEEVVTVLQQKDFLHPDLETIRNKRGTDGTATSPPEEGPTILEEIRKYADKSLLFANANASYQDYGEDKNNDLIEAYKSMNKYYANVLRREKLGVAGASYRRPFIHVDGAHGGAFLTLPSLRDDTTGFKGIELVDTVTIDGHKMFYCYYPCGGLLIRTTRWAHTLHGGHSSYISEDTNHEAYGEDREYLRGLPSETPRSEKSHLLIDGTLRLRRKEMARLDAVRGRNGRPTSAPRSELEHHPFTSCLEGSRGCQGIMQMYFNLRTIGFEGYRSLLEWTYLLARRCEEAVSLGRIDVRSATDGELETDQMLANSKQSVMQFRNVAKEREKLSDDRPEPARIVPEARRIVPVLGGRLLRLSAGQCNQLLVSYVPLDIAMHICTRNKKDWEEELKKEKVDKARPGSNLFWQTIHYLWRVNEHLWSKYLYANPSFTYYVGHTELEPILPAPVRKDESKSTPDKVVAVGTSPEYRRKLMASLLAQWNVWTRWTIPEIAQGEPEAEIAKGNPEAETAKGEPKLWSCPFFEVMAENIQDPSQPRGPDQFREGAVRFFAHKIVVMHPYTDESILSDLLGKMMFWGERSADAVRFADAASEDWLASHPRPKKKLAAKGKKQVSMQGKPRATRSGR